MKQQSTHLIGINNHDIIANICIRTIGRLVLSLQYWCNGCGQSAHGLIGGIDEMPCSLDGSAGEAHRRWYEGRCWWWC